MKNNKPIVFLPSGDVWSLASTVSGACKRGDLTEAERLQRRLIDRVKGKLGIRDIITAAALFDLVLILEQQEGRSAEALQLRLLIKDILNALDAPVQPRGNGGVARMNSKEVKRRA